MMRRSLLAAAAASALLTSSRSFVIPTDIDALPQSVLSAPQEPIFDVSSDPLPVLIWHGLGDSADSDGMNSVASLIEDTYPGTYVYPISAAGDGGSDATASWFGDVNSQIEFVCNEIASDPILSTAPAVDAVGFSQGGQFLRGYIEKCGHWAPPVRSLITFGSQHNGIAQFAECQGWTDFLCNSANLLINTGLVWGDLVQKKVVPAQYYRPLSDLENYMNYSNYLADLNNERSEKNATYAKNLAQLENFVMVLFEDDKTVIPKETGWFAEVNSTAKEITALQNRTIYKEDWIGLKKLDEKGALIFETVPGEHMRLRAKDLVQYFTKYFGPTKKVKNVESKAWYQAEL